MLQSKVPVGDYKQYQAWYDMGWLLYKEGNSAEALSYAEAAVQSNMSTIRHEHLATIATVLHSPTASAFARKTDHNSARCG